jgi:SIR2-like domain
MAKADIGVTETPTEAPPAGSSFSFLKGSENFFATKEGVSNDFEKTSELVREQLSEAMNSRNVAFLLGAGCSSLVSGTRQLGIATMPQLAKEFAETVGEDKDETFPTAAERTDLRDKLGLDIAAPEFAQNIERLMECLHCYQFAFGHSILEDHKPTVQLINRVSKKVERFVLMRCTGGAFASGDDTVCNLYQTFYRKLIFRDRALPRPWVFTLNYDLFNETAMDRLGLPYCNGFSGAIERRFNPALFRYALAEQLDITSRKWSAVDGFVYLCKLHGSVSWVEEEQGLFPIREKQKPDLPDRVMIYPTPAKHHATLASPYADLFREFHTRIVREQSVLFSIGYGFGDEHINNIIYQALTIPTFRLVIFAAPNSGGQIGKLRELHDPRVWIIGGEIQGGAKGHYFTTVVDKFMPEPPGDRIDTAVRRVVEELIAPDRESKPGESGDAV